MTLRIALAVLVGGGIGLAVGSLGKSAGGQCLVLCNPYVSTVVGVLVGLMLARALEPTDLTPTSKNVLVIEGPDALEAAVAGSGKVALVEFYTVRCPACRRQMSVLGEVADDFVGRATIAVANVGHVREVARRLDVSGVPTSFIFQDGEPVERLEGFHGKAKVTEALERHLQAAAEPPGPKGEPEGQRP